MFFVLFRQTGADLHIQNGSNCIEAHQVSSFMFSNVFFSELLDAEQYADDAITYFVNQNHNKNSEEYFRINRDFYPLTNFLTHFSHKPFITYEIVSSTPAFEQLIKTQYTVGTLGIIQSLKIGLCYRYDTESRFYFPWFESIDSLGLWEADGLKLYQKSVELSFRQCFEFTYTNDINLRSKNFIKIPQAFQTKHFHLFNQKHLLEHILQAS